MRPLKVGDKVDVLYSKEDLRYIDVVENTAKVIGIYVWGGSKFTRWFRETFLNKSGWFGSIVIEFKSIRDGHIWFSGFEMNENGQSNLLKLKDL